MLLHYTVADTEPKSHTFTDIFGSEKRIENFLQIFRRNPFAIIPHDNQALAIFLDAANPDGRSTFRAMLFSTACRAFCSRFTMTWVIWLRLAQIVWCSGISFSTLTLFSHSLLRRRKAEFTTSVTETFSSWVRWG